MTPEAILKHGRGLVRVSGDLATGKSAKVEEMLKPWMEAGGRVERWTGVALAGRLTASIVAEVRGLASSVPVAVLFRDLLPASDTLKERRQDERIWEAARALSAERLVFVEEYRPGEPLRVSFCTEIE